MTPTNTIATAANIIATGTAYHRRQRAKRLQAMRPLRIVAVGVSVAKAPYTVATLPPLGGEADRDVTVI